eukprot:861962-Lingulodinium_polyedra.AAC.1
MGGDDLHRRAAAPLRLQDPGDACGGPGAGGLQAHAGPGRPAPSSARRAATDQSDLRPEQPAGLGRGRGRARRPRRRGQ